MKNKRLFDIVGEIDDRHIAEAAPAAKKSRKPVWVKWDAMAACLAVVVITAVSVLPNYLNQQGTMPPDDPNSIITDNSNDDTPPATPDTDF